MILQTRYKFLKLNLKLASVNSIFHGKLLPMAKCCMIRLANLEPMSGLLILDGLAGNMGLAKGLMLKIRRKLSI